MHHSRRSTLLIDAALIDAALVDAALVDAAADQAEVARPQELGAVEESSRQGCHTLRVVGGQLLCVIPLHSDPETFLAPRSPLAVTETMRRRPGRRADPGGEAVRR